MAKVKEGLVAKGFSQVQDVDYSQTLAPTPSPAPIKIRAAVSNEQGLNVFRSDLTAFVRANRDAGIYIKITYGCGGMSGEIVCHNKSLYGLNRADGSGPDYW